MRFLHMQCARSHIPYPVYALQWIDIRKAFGHCYKKRGGLSYMLKQLDIEPRGMLHCGLDDSRNIASIVIRIIRDGFWLDINDKMPAKMR